MPDTDANASNPLRFWHGRMRDALARYREAAAKALEIIQEQQNGLLPSPDGVHALSQAHKEEALALQEYRHLLHISLALTPPALGDELTARETQVLLLIAGGMSSKQIAEHLGIAFKTAMCHRCRILAKLGVRNTAGMVRSAMRLGLIEL